MSSRKTTLRFCSSGGPLQDNWAKTQACILIFGFGLAFFSTVNGEEATDIFDLFATAARGDIAGVQSRLEAHPAWVDVEQGGKTLLWEAAERGDTNIVALLLRFGANIEAKDRQASRTALWMAVCNRHQGAAELLLKHGADPKTTSHSGFTILHMCASKEAIPLLLAYKADVNARDITKRTPLHWAVEGAKVENVEALLASGASVDDGDSMGWTPLHLAAIATVSRAIGVIDGPYTPTERETAELQTNMVRIMELLLSHKANVEAKDTIGFTPLLRAAEAGNNVQARFLLAHAANVNARDSSGCTPLCRALENLHKDTASLLLEKGAQTDMFTAAGLGMKERVASLLAANHGLINATGFLDRTPLHWAVDNGETETAKLLVESGSGLELRDVYGWTPLAICVQRGRVDILKLLIAKHADVNTKDRFGKSALAAATELHQDEIVHLLRQNGANE